MGAAHGGCHTGCRFPLTASDMDRTEPRPEFERKAPDPRESTLRWIEDLGDTGITAGSRLLDVLYLLANSAAGLITFQRGLWRHLRQITVQQIYFTAVQAWLLVGFVGLVLGVLTMLPLHAFRVNDLDLVAQVVTVVLTHQITPLMVALIVIGRSGTAVTAELGELQTNQTFDTLLAMGLEPHQLLVLPRLVGITLSLLVLGFWANAAAMLGAGLYSALFQEIRLHAFFRACFAVLDRVQVLGDMLLLACFGITIALVHCLFGLLVRDPMDIPRRLPQAFVVSALGCVLLTLALSVALNV